MSAHPPRPLLPEETLAGGPVDEHAWLEVVRKMDEVYSDLLQYEVELEEKNAALESSQQFIESILSSMSDVLVVCDRHGRVEEANAALLRVTGRDAAQLKGRPVAELAADAGSRERIETVFRRLRHDGVEDCEIDLRGADGTPVTVAMNCTPRTSAVGRVVGMVLTGRPVGELRRAYTELRRAHEELKQAQHQLLQAEKMASLGRLVAGVAHELNNPISFVLGNVHSMKRYAARVAEYLEAVHDGTPAGELEGLRRRLRIDAILSDLAPLIDGTVEGAERTRAIVEGLKRFSSPDRSMDSVFDAGEVTRRAAGWVVKAGRGSLRLVADIAPGLWVRGSMGQVEQVVVNLVQNAADSTEGRPDARLEISGRIEDGQVYLLFRDNGPGIHPKHLAQVFDPFFTTKPVGQGTGLGLSISYGIVERHGGRLSAANAPGGGAEFRVVMPLHAA